MTGAVVVVSYGSAALLERNLVPLARSAPDLLVVVVDNVTTPAERGRIRALGEREGFSVVAPDRNLGFGAGADAGIRVAREAGCDAFVLINPDAWTTVPVVRTLLAAVREDPSLLVSPEVVRPDGSPWFVRGVLDLQDGRTSTRGRIEHRPGGRSTAEWLSGACLAAATSGWWARGGFDHRFFLYWEDVELSLRWQAAGGRLLVRHDLVVQHAVGGTQEGAAGKSDLYVRHSCRNRLLIGATLGPATFGRWVLLAPAYAWEVVRRGGRRELLRRPSMLVAAVRGTAEGVAAGARHIVSSWREERRGDPQTGGREGEPSAVAPARRSRRSRRTYHQ